MKLLTDWASWWKPNRKEMAFHCDLILEPGEWVEIRSSAGHMQRIKAPRFAKAHLSASWEHRFTMFAEGDDADDLGNL